jgi:iron complex outermembrane recepter protein
VCDGSSSRTTRSPPTPDGAEAAERLDGITVEGRAQSLYEVEEGSLATRTDTPLREVPQSIQVIPRQLIDDQAARQITDLYRSIAGISFFSYSGVTLRGFRQDEILYDGVRGDPFNGFAIPQLFNIERVEVLKGPSGALYGSGQPGGVINYVTKSPQAEPLRVIELQVGDQDFRAASFEATGTLTGERGLRYRAGLYYDEEDPFRFATRTENQIVDLGLGMDVGQEGELVVKYADIVQDYFGARLRGVPVNDAGVFLTDRRWNHNEPTDYQNLDARVAQARWDQAWSGSFSTDLTLRWYENTELQNYHEPRGLRDLDRDGFAEWMTREFRDQRRDNDAVSLTGNAVAAWGSGAVRHTLLVGVDALRQDSDFAARTATGTERGGPVPGLHLLNPLYGATSAADYNLDALPLRGTRDRSDRQGVYLQDQIDVGDDWHLLLGVRHDRFEDENRLVGTSVDGSDESWRIGVGHDFAPSLTGYATVATGFAPQAAGSQLAEVGGPFDAEQSSLVEAGVKAALFDEAVTVNAAVYQIERENILQPDLRGDVGNDGFDDMVALGLVRSQGVELEVLGDLTAVWVLNVAYAYNDTRIIEQTGAVTNAVGDRFANAPRNQLGIWTRYDFPAIRSAIALGADHVDERLSLDGQRVKSYTVFDASWQTRWQDWFFQVNVKNLFDRTYAASGFIARTGHFPGEPRRVYLQASYEF